MRRSASATKAGVFALALCAGLALADEPVATPGLSVEGTSLVLHQADGKTLRGTQLQGMVLNLPVGNRIRAVQLASITPDPDDSDILRHEFRTRGQDGQWRPLCEANYDKETWGFAVSPTVAGESGSAVHVTCASGAIAKCIRYGYKPWVKGFNGEDLAPYHAACVHMIRADYAGDGTPHTKPGTFIRYHDDAVKRHTMAINDGEFAFEAGWSPQGAVCVAQVRWPEFGSLDAILKSDARLAATPPAACTEPSARAKGALIFQASRIRPRLGP